MLQAIRFAFIVSLVFLSSFRTDAAVRIDFNETCLAAQQSIYQLKLGEALVLLKSAHTKDPENVAVDYLMVVKSMLSYVTNETSNAYVRFDSVKNAAINRISSGEKAEGYRDFLLEEIYFYSSVVNGKRGNTLAAALDVRKSYNLGMGVIENHPQFYPAKKTIGLLHSGFGSLPNNYQKLVQFFGYGSSMDNGIKMLQDFINVKKGRPEWTLMQKEAQFYVASIHLHLKNDKTTAWNLADSLTKDYASNPLSGFARVHFADKCRRNDEIIKVVQKIPTAKPYGSIPFLQFMLGKAKLNRLDNDADESLLQYLNDYDGMNYVKSCYQKLSWDALIKGDEKSYNKYLALIKTKGNTNLEEDDQAFKYAQSGIKPNVTLLKTRLLFDGGYYNKALEIIRPQQAANFNTVLLKTEYFYRKGRVYDALNNSKLAEAFYLEAMREGEFLPQYYASYAALYLAELHEKLGNDSKAKLYFYKAMSFSANKEYKKSIEHRAKKWFRSN